MPNPKGNVRQEYKRTLKPSERRALVEQLFKGANPIVMMEEYNVSYQTLMSTMSKWKEYIRLKAYFFHDDEIDPYK